MPNIPIIKPTYLAPNPLFIWNVLDANWLVIMSLRVLYFLIPDTMRRQKYKKSRELAEMVCGNHIRRHLKLHNNRTTPPYYFVSCVI